MKLGLNVGYSGAQIRLPIDLIQLADRLGYDSVWTAEAYGSDAVTPLAWIGAQTQRIKLGTAIMQMPARTPAMTAMTAITLDQLSGGRFLLGLGLSGPQVVEGWHGQPYGKPLVRTREYVAIVREILARKQPLAYQGDYYTIPYVGEDATGLGKPLKSILHGRADLPIYLAAIGPRNVELAAEIADGWLPFLLSPEHYDQAFGAAVETGRAKAALTEAGARAFDIAPSVTVVLGDDIDMCRAMVKPLIALYVGGMGAKGRNFYFDLVSRYGFGEPAAEIQRLFLSGRRDEAIESVPNALVDAVALCGPKERILEGLERWQASPVTTLIVNTSDPAVIQLLADAVLGPNGGNVNKSFSLPDNDQKDAINSDGKIMQEQVKASGAKSVFAAMAERLAARPEIVKKVGAVYRFDITGDNSGTWTVDLKNGVGSVHEGEPPQSNITITVSESDFVAFANGSLDPMAAFTSGKVKVKGNVMLATKLQPLFAYA